MSTSKPWLSGSIAGVREDCEHFQSRTYPDGEAARFCELNLAPEAPWRCPKDCKAYERRLVDLSFDRGSLAYRQVEEDPVANEDELAVLAQAEELVEEAIPEMLHELGRDGEGGSDGSFKPDSLSDDPLRPTGPGGQLRRDRSGAASRGSGALSRLFGRRKRYNS